MTLTRIKIGMFLAAITAPLLALVLFGAVSPYGNSNLPKFPKPSAVLRGKTGSLDAFGDAVLRRSVVTKQAILFKNRLGLDLVGFVDTNEVVSGLDDWLYLKGELSKSCIDEHVTRRALAGLDVMTGLARAAGLDMIVTLSPDKATIYPEFAHPQALRYWRCKAQSGATLRRLLRDEMPSLIDHTTVLLAEKARHPGIKLYFHTDTHWTPYGYALAARQLLSAAFPTAGAMPPPKLDGHIAKQHTDLRNDMLLQTELESYDEIDTAAEAKLSAANSDPASLKTVILGDSFYAAARDELKRVFPGAATYHIDSDDKVYPAAIATADRLIVNSVERTFPVRISKSTMSWSSTLAAAILARNEERAKSCTGFAAVDGGDASIALPDSGSATCLRLNVSSPKAGTVRVALTRSGETGFEDGREVPLTTPDGTSSVSLVLPSGTGSLHMVPSTGVTIQSIELGKLPPAPEPKG